MDYQYVAPPEKFNNGTWFGHHMTLFVRNGKLPELEQWLEQYVGPRTSHWRELNPEIVNQSRKGAPPKFVWSFSTDKKRTFRFSNKAHAMLLKLVWTECQDPIDELSKMMTAIKATLSLYPGIGGNITTVRPTGNPLPWTQHMGLISQSSLQRQLNVRESDWAKYLFEEPKPQHERAYMVKSRANTLTTEQLQERINNGIHDFKTIYPWQKTPALSECDQPESQAQPGTGTN